VTEVGIGTAIIAYIEPHEGQAEAFNRWYERDHMYAAATGGPGAFAGARWVATRACKALRPPNGVWFGDTARGSFLTTVWVLDGSQEEFDTWIARQMDQLREEGGRMFAGRDHLRTAVYRFEHELRTETGVSAATALDHPFAGVIVLAVSARSGPAVMRSIVGAEIPTAAVFTTERVIMAEGEAPAHDLVLGFTVADPIAAWHARVEPVLASLPHIGFASPFIRTIPGTDAYVGEI
jgi:hypothetical protein